MKSLENPQKGGRVNPEESQLKGVSHTNSARLAANVWATCGGDRGMFLYKGQRASYKGTRGSWGSPRKED